MPFRVSLFCCHSRKKCCPRTVRKFPTRKTNPEAAGQPTPTLTAIFFGRWSLAYRMVEQSLQELVLIPLIAVLCTPSSLMTLEKSLVRPVSYLTRRPLYPWSLRLGKLISTLEETWLPQITQSAAGWLILLRL